MAEIRAARRALNRSLRRQRVFLDRLNPLECLKDDRDVKAWFRFRRDTVYTILGLVEDFVTRPTQRSMSMPPLLVLCVALRYFAGGSFYLMLGDYANSSPASVHHCVKMVCAALKHIAGDFIKFPNVAAMEKLKEDFYEIAGTVSLICFAKLFAHTRVEKK